MLRKTAVDSGFFASIEIYNLERLRSEAPEWMMSNKSFLENNPRGFGYWIWKPQLIKLQLLKLKKHDSLLYLDAGCQINKFGGAKLESYVNETIKSGMLCFYLNGPNYRIEQWTKASLLEYFGVTTDASLLDLPQVESGVVFLNKTEENLVFLDKWESICQEANYALVDDTPSTVRNNINFIEHRHDMAVFTLLHYCLRWGKSMRNENYFPSLWRAGSHPKTFPVCAFRSIAEGRPSLTNLMIK